MLSGVCRGGGGGGGGGGVSRRRLVCYVLITPLLGSALGRQGSSGSGSWANTESSPEEQVLLESWQVGEYCSKGTARSRYSCWGRPEVRPGRRWRATRFDCISLTRYRSCQKTHFNLSFVFLLQMLCKESMWRTKFFSHIDPQCSHQCHKWPHSVPSWSECWL